MYTPISFLGFNDPFSSLSHLLALVFFIVLNIYLIYHGRGNKLRVASLIIYSVTVAFLLAMSGVYHLLPDGSTSRHVLRRLDHAGIWMLIAGSFTPIHVILMTGFWRWGILGIVWTTSITGLVLEAVFFRDFPEYLSLIFYLSLGWVGILGAINYLKTHPGRSIKYMVWGGLSYSIGAIFDFLKWPILIPGVVAYHELFHLATIGGIYFHWRFMYQIASVGITQQLTLKIKERIDENQKTYFFVTSPTEKIRFIAQTEGEILEKINQQIETLYHHYRRPKCIRLQYMKEQFIMPHPKEKKLASGELFHGKGDLGPSHGE